MNPKEKELFEKFRASHKALTRYEDILSHDGNLENVLAGYSLGDLKAIHVYDSGLYIEEGWPDRVAKSSRGVMVTECFCCTIGNQSETAETLEELEPMLFEFWRWECYPAPRGSVEHIVKHPDTYGREQLLDFLQKNDPNGEYTDSKIPEDSDPITWDEAVGLVRDLDVEEVVL